MNEQGTYGGVSQATGTTAGGAAGVVKDEVQRLASEAKTETARVASPARDQDGELVSRTKDQTAQRLTSLANVLRPGGAAAGERGRRRLRPLRGPRRRPVEKASGYLAARISASSCATPRPSPDAIPIASSATRSSPACWSRGSSELGAVRLEMAARPAAGRARTDSLPGQTGFGQTATASGDYARTVSRPRTRRAPSPSTRRTSRATAAPATGTGGFDGLRHHSPDPSQDRSLGELLRTSPTRRARSSARKSSSRRRRCPRRRPRVGADVGKIALGAAMALLGGLARPLRGDHGRHRAPRHVPAPRRGRLARAAHRRRGASSCSATAAPPRRHRRPEGTSFAPRQTTQSLQENKQWLQAKIQ